MAKTNNLPQHTKKFFGSHKEALRALFELEKCDLVSGLTPENEALDFCVKVLEVLAQSQKLNFKDENVVTLYNSLLKFQGCVKYSEANQKHIPMPRAMMRDTFVPNNIQFALNVFTKLFDGNVSGYAFIMGEEGSAFIEKWLNIQYQSNPELKPEKFNHEKSILI